MIESMTGGYVVETKTPCQAPIADHPQLNTLTLERNTVLIARISRDSGYSLGDLQTLRETLKCVFPNHEVFVWYDDVDFMTIHDKGYNSPSLEGLNATSTYY